MSYNNSSHIIYGYVLYESTIISYIFFAILLFIICLCNINCFLIYKSVMNKIKKESNESNESNQPHYSNQSHYSNDFDSDFESESESESKRILTDPPSYESLSD